jgi:hypothetical protein
MNQNHGLGGQLADAIDAALAVGRDEEFSALGLGLTRLKQERAGASERVVAWESCLLPPPPETDL